MSAALFRSRPIVPAGTFRGFAEGPACDRSGALYAVGCPETGSIGRIAEDGAWTEFLRLPAPRVGNGIRFARSGEWMFVADYVGHAILAVELATARFEVWAEDPAMHQPNDLAITAGDLLFASDPHFESRSGRIWRIGPDRLPTVLDGAMGTTNGIETSPDDSILYVDESLERRIWAFDLSPAGEISGKRLLHEFDDGQLDGMRCDVDGNLYVARFDASAVAVISPAGDLHPRDPGRGRAAHERRIRRQRRPHVLRDRRRPRLGRGLSRRGTGALLGALSRLGVRRRQRRAALRARATPHTSRAARRRRAPS